MTQPDTVTFFAPGVPAPGGSKRALHFGGKVRMIDMGKRNRPWRRTVALFAAQVMAGRPPMEGPLWINVVFRMPRPKYHFRANGQLKPTAPKYHIIKPDLTKLWRSTEDAMTSIVWVDDAQIVGGPPYKYYADAKNPVGAMITVSKME